MVLFDIPCILLSCQRGPLWFSKETWLITPNKALSIVLECARPLGAVRKPLFEALGYCLAEDILADRDMPPADCSLMDGYAVRSSDLVNCPCTVRVVGEVAAGSAARPRVRPGTCVRVLTGANIPPGADAVVMVEQTKEADGLVTFRTTVPVASNIRRQGEEAKKGAVLLKKKTVLGPVQIGLCSAVGKAKPRVHRHPDVAVLCTGEELRPLGLRLRTHERRDSNGVALFLALCDYGCTNTCFGFVSDDLELLSLKANQALSEYDVLIFTGGVSVGNYDFVPEAVRQIGAKVRFHGVAMKPGKPILYATLRGNRHIFGLPGNPLSAMTGFYEFVLPALRRMSSVPVKECRPTMRLPLSRDLRTDGERVKFVPAKLLRTKTRVSVCPLKSHGSADIVAGAHADGVVVIPPGSQKSPAGRLVEFRPWRAQPW